MAPFSDTINHHNVDSSYDVIKAEWKPMPIEEKLQRFPILDPDAHFSLPAEPTQVQEQVTNVTTDTTVNSD